MKYFYLVICFLIASGCFAGKNEYETVFAARKGKDPVKCFRIYTFGGAKVSLSSTTEGALNIKSSVPLATVAGKKAAARISLNREIIAETMTKIRNSGRRLAGVDFLVEGPANAGKNFSVVLNFGPKLDRQFTLQPGTERFVFTPKLAAPPFAWDDLTYVLITFAHGSAPELTVKEIRFKTAPMLPVRKLGLSRPRTAVEILPSGAVFREFFRRPEMKKVSNGPEIFISYDRENIYVKSVASYSKKPAASVVRKDDRVYQDEAFEVFFASKLDNRAYDQFTINALGTVRDERFGFDPDAVMVRNMLEHDFKHRQKLDYDGKRMCYDLTFPLSEFDIDLVKTPVCEFQLAQVVDHKSHVLGISPKDRNFDLPSFSMAVFNKKKFGRGKIRISSAGITGSGGSAAIIAEVEVSDLPDGKYNIDFIVSTPDFRRVDCSGGVWQIRGGKGRRSFRLNRLPDVNGVYVIRALLKNRQKNVLAGSVDAENLKPVSYRFSAGDFQPQIKKYRKTAGTFAAGGIKRISVPKDASARTLKTAELFQKYLLDYAGAETTVVKAGKADVYLSIDPGKTGRNKQGYLLKVSPQKVEITGTDEPGLYYGIQTFMQMVKMPMRRTAESPVGCCEIFDWPDLLIRPAALWHPRSVPGSAEVVEPTSVEYICDFVERFAAANKLNFFRLRIDKSLMFNSHPRFKKYAAKRYYSMDDLKKITAFCRERFIEVIPVLPGGGHDALIDVFPEFRDIDWKANGDVAKPGYMKLYLACVQELLDATGCRYFACGGDEWYFKREPKRIHLKLPEKIHGKTRAQVFLDFHLELHRYLKERNVRMLIAHDMLIPDKNGRSFDIYKTLDKFPRDIIILVWSPSKNEKLFAERGMEMWYASTGSDIPEKTRKFYSGYYSSLYLFGTELSFRFPGAYKYHSKWFITADAGWNFFTGKDTSLETGLADGRLAGVESLFAETASPYAGEKTVPLALPGGEKIDTAVHRFYPHVYPSADGNIKFGRKSGEFGNICMKLSNRAVAVAPGMKTAVVKVGKKVSGLIFLHSAFEDEKYRKSRKFVMGSVKNAWQRGYPVANYRVVYSDGTKEVIPIRLGAQIYWFGYQPMAGSCTHTRYMYIGYDSVKRPFFIYQYEWVNPHPQKEIVSVELAHDNPSNFRSLVFAISARELKK